MKARTKTPDAPKLWPALLGLFFFAFTFRSSSGVYLIGMITVLLWLSTTQLPRAPLLPKPLTTAAKIYLGVLGIHLSWTLLANEYSLIETFEGYRHYVELLLFIPFSVVLYHCRAYWLYLLWIPVTAVVVRILHRTDFSSLDTTLFYKWIYGFGQHHVTFGMQAMLAIIAVIALAPLTFKHFDSKAKRAICAFGIVAIASLILQALITSGSRSAWGSLLVGIVALVFCSRKNIIAINHKTKALFALAFVVSISLVINKNMGKFEQRLANDTQVDFHFSLSIEDLPRDEDLFFARRAHLVYFGWQKWQERPALGHGPAAIRPLLAADVDFNIHPHLHNTYIQVLVELGIFGSVALFAVFSVLFYYLWKNHPTHEKRNRPVYNLIVASMLSLAVWSIAGFHLHSSDWRFVFIWYTAFAAFLIRRTHHVDDKNFS